MSRSKAIAIGTLVLISASTHVSAQSANTARPLASATQGVRTAAAPSLPAVTVPANGVSLRIPYLRNHCRLDDKVAFDKTLIDSIGKNFTSGPILLATVDCQALKRGRAGDESGGLEATFVASTADRTTNASPRAEYAKQACDAVSRAPGFIQLSGAPKDKIAELQNRSTAADSRTMAALNTTRRACYVGSIIRSGDALISQTIATTLVKGQRLTLTTISVNGTALPALVDKAGQLVTELSKANGEG